MHTQVDGLRRPSGSPEARSCRATAATGLSHAVLLPGQNRPDRSIVHSLGLSSPILTSSIDLYTASKHSAQRLLGEARDSRSTWSIATMVRVCRTITAGLLLLLVSSTASAIKVIQLIPDVSPYVPACAASSTPPVLARAQKFTSRQRHRSARPAYETDPMPKSFAAVLRR